MPQGEIRERGDLRQHSVVEEAKPFVDVSVGQGEVGGHEGQAQRTYAGQGLSQAVLQGSK